MSHEYTVFKNPETEQFPKVEDKKGLEERLEKAFISGLECRYYKEEDEYPVYYRIKAIVPINHERALGKTSSVHARNLKRFKSIFSRVSEHTEPFYTFVCSGVFLL